MRFKSVIVGLALACVSMVGGCDRGSPSPARESGSSTTTPASADASGRCPHEIKADKCPFCTPSLIESEGLCGEHGVAEALCVQCKPYLRAAFRAKGDWCAEHNMPESQCVQCNPALADNIRPGEHGTALPASAVTCEHGLATAKCPFCTPSLVESMGTCEEHQVAEALCVKCHPDLEAAFKAANDWCVEHATPESQCVLCNPELNTTPPGNG